MKTKLLCLMIALCIILSFIPVSAEEAPAITIITQPAETVVTRVSRELCNASQR